MNRISPSIPDRRCPAVSARGGGSRWCRLWARLRRLLHLLPHRPLHQMEHRRGLATSVASGAKESRQGFVLGRLDLLRAAPHKSPCPSTVLMPEECLGTILVRFEKSSSLGPSAGQRAAWALPQSPCLQASVGRKGSGALDLSVRPCMISRSFVLVGQLCRIHEPATSSKCLGR